MHSLHDPLDNQAHCEHIDFGLVLIRHQKVFFCEVHTDRLGDQGLEELHHKSKRDALTLQGTGRSEIWLIDSVNIERDPVSVFLFVWEKIAIYLSLDLGNPIGVANSWVVIGDSVHLDHFEFFGLIRSNTEIDQMLKWENWFSPILRRKAC